MTQGELGPLELLALPVVFIAGCLFTVQNVRERRSHRIARRTWSRAIAEVVSVERRSSSFGIEIRGVRVGTSGEGSYFATLRFLTDTGAEVVGEPLGGGYGDGQVAPRIGKPVAVLYDPTSPHSFLTESRASLRMGTLAAAIGIVVPLVFFATAFA